MTRRCGGFARTRGRGCRARDEQVVRGAVAARPEPHGTVFPGGAGVGAVAGGVVACGGLASAAGSSPSAASSPSTGSGSTSRVGAATVARTVSSRSSSRVTPCGAVSAESRSESPIRQSRDICFEVLGDLHRERLNVQLVRHLRQDAAFLHADGLAVQWSGTVAWIGWSRRTSCRSTWVISPRTGSCW